MTSEIERELLNVEQPDPPAALRQRVLAAATPLVQPDRNRLDAIWFSPRWRVVAVVVFLGLIAADGLSSVTDEPPQRSGPQVRTSAEEAVQAAIDAGLGTADVAAIAAQASLRQTGDLDTIRRVRMDLTGVPQ
jgi:hypothetical protein